MLNDKKSPKGIVTPSLWKNRWRLFESQKERKLFLLTWGPVAAFIVWHFYFGPRANIEYRWRWHLVWEYRKLLLWGIGNTMYIFAWSLVFSLTLGIFCGIGRTTKIRWIRILSTGYVELFRNVPLLVVMWWAYFGLQEVVNGFINQPFGLKILIPNFFAAIMAISLFIGAYMGEIVRSGISSIPRGQWEASVSMGLTRVQTWRHIILPQALAVVIPPMSGQVINIIKSSAVAMTITVTDLMYYSKEIEERTFAGFEAMTAGTVLFLVLNILTVGIIYGLKRFFRIKVRRAT
jgi:His/Glu/Gln/Arg/opine family amino acid ABC transporter permease subunit